MVFETVIRGGEIVDGTGCSARRADVAIDAGRIALVGDLSGVEAAVEIDARGKLVTPGYVDCHAHSEVGIYMNPICHSQVAQGITTEISGNCGYSPFPLLENNRGLLLEPPGVEVPWTGAQQFFDCLESRGMGINMVPQIGHLTIRSAALNREDRPAKRDEVEQMKSWVRAAMEAGVCGLSTGLDYSPSRSSDLQELVDLVEVVAEYGGFYTSHIRGYTENVLNAIAEAIEVGRRTGVRVQISHMGIAGRPNWGRAERILYLMDRARLDGVQVGCDMMAYPTSGAWWGPRAVLPNRLYDWHKSWADNLDGIRAELRDSNSRQALKKEIEASRTRPKRGWDEEALVFSDWRDIYIEELPYNSPRGHLIGMDMESAAAEEGQEPCDLFLDLLLHEGEEFGSVRIAKSPKDFSDLFCDEWTMFCTDSIGTSLQTMKEPWNTIQPHRRHYGTFPRILGKFVRDDGVIPLSEAVRRMSALPAEHFGLDHRGYLREGYWADLVVVDMLRVKECGTWRLPAAYPDGICYVFINGVPAVAEGRFSGHLAGRMLRTAG